MTRYHFHAGFTALALLASPALAQYKRDVVIQQSGDNNEANIIQAAKDRSQTSLLQDGHDNVATIRSNSENADATIDQYGGFADAKINQSRSTVGNSALIAQLGTSQATITQTGYTEDQSHGLVAQVWQWDIGVATVKQDGSTNRARVVQGVGSGFANGAPTVDLQQTGDDNHADLRQAGGAVDSRMVVTQGFGNTLGDVPTQQAYENDLYIYETGAHQVAYAHQDNNNARGVIDQYGSDNMSDSTQGNNTILGLTQSGNGLYANIYQAQNAFAEIDQSGSNNSLSVWQDGGSTSGWYIRTKINQSGTNNRLNVSQSGPGGLF